MAVKIKEDELGLLTDAQLAKLLRTKRHTLAVWRCSKRHGLPYLRIGRKPYYRKQDVLDWLAARVVRPQAESAD